MGKSTPRQINMKTWEYAPGKGKITFQTIVFFGSMAIFAGCYLTEVHVSGSCCFLFVTFFGMFWTLGFFNIIEGHKVLHVVTWPLALLHYIVKALNGFLLIFSNYFYSVGTHWRVQVVSYSGRTVFLMLRLCSNPSKSLEVNQVVNDQCNCLIPCSLAYSICYNILLANVTRIIILHSILDYKSL